MEQISAVFQKTLDPNINIRQEGKKIINKNKNFYLYYF